MKILIINGPNLQLLGEREPEVYGNVTLSVIVEAIRQCGDKLDIGTDFFQSNIEGEICDRIAAAKRENVDGIVINAGAYTHYSIAILDALKGVGIPFVEVHLSNVHSREEFRRHSVLASAAVGVIAGFGVTSYLLALQALVGLIKNKNTPEKQEK